MKYFLLTVTCGTLLMLFASGCSIEEADLPDVGAVYVTLSDTAGVPIERAAISVDGEETSQYTPALVAGLAFGTHVIGAVRSDVDGVTATVDVTARDTFNVDLVTTFRPVGAVNLIAAPDSTVLLINALPSGTTPPSLLYVGIGTHRASLYLPGHATDLPAMWTLTVTQNDTVDLAANFTPVAMGSQPLDLAPIFALADDRDSSIFRLQDYRGHVVLLTFFFVDCAPCVAEMPHIQEVYEMDEYEGKIEFFGIDPQDIYFTFSQFRTIRHPELGLTFPLLYGTQQGVREAYNVIPFPSNIFIDQTGRVRFREAGVNVDILRNHIDALLAEAGE